MLKELETRCNSIGLESKEDLGFSTSEELEEVLISLMAEVIEENSISA
tara:strand:+ start:119 stop:262 length:144 start_codon:yes stop_codon:yes gene_type:complete